MNLDVFSPTQRRIVEILQDGHPHQRWELAGCLPTDAPNYRAKVKRITAYVMGIRRILRAEGLDILCLYEGRGRSICYQLVRLISRPGPETLQGSSSR